MKSVFAIGLIFLSSVYATAQSDRPSLGIVAGPGVQHYFYTGKSSAFRDYMKRYSGSPGFTAGIYGQYRIGRYFSLGTSLMWKYEVIKADFTGRDAPAAYLTKYESKRHSFLVPCMLQLHTRPSRLQGFMNLGMYFESTFSAKDHYTLNFHGETGYEELKFQSISFGALAGIGIRKVLRERMDVNAELRGSFADVGGGSDGLFSGTFNFLLGWGYRF